MDRGELNAAVRAVLGLRDSAVEDAAWAATLAARAAYPGVAVEATSWVCALRRSKRPIDTLCCEDLWLAAALAEGDPAALRVFETKLLPIIDRALVRFKLDTDAREELRQQVRVRLLVADGRTHPRIQTYGGDGRLAAWVRTVASRVALNHRRAERRVVGLDDLPEFALPDSPEIRTLDAEGRQVLLDTLRRSFRALPPETRTLLRLRHCQGLSLSALARAYTVHESTMSRRLTAARAELAHRFHAAATEQLGPTALSRAWRLVHSQVESSLDRLLDSRASVA